MIKWTMDEVEMNSDIEQFPAEKKRIRIDEPPEMFFFDVDEESEEADFIRVDDLFRMDPDADLPLTGPVSFTFFPEQRGVFISSRLSRLIRRTLILTASRIGLRAEKLRVRPLFAQLLLCLSDADSPEEIALELRRDLEMQAKNISDLNTQGRFWSNSCLVCRASEELSDDLITRLAAQVREE